MNADELAVQRAAWAVALKQEFASAGYIAQQHVNDYQTLFVLNHQAAPGWRVTTIVCSAHSQRNRIEINGVAIVHNIGPSDLTKLMNLLASLRESYAALGQQSREVEAKAAEWMERQQKELHGLEELNGVDIEIITRGTYEGQYRVTLQPGNPLEHLTLEQFRAFHQFLQTL